MAQDLAYHFTDLGMTTSQPADVILEFQAVLSSLECGSPLASPHGLGSARGGPCSTPPCGARVGESAPGSAHKRKRAPPHPEEASSASFLSPVPPPPAPWPGHESDLSSPRLTGAPLGVSLLSPPPGAATPPPAPGTAAASTGLKKFSRLVCECVAERRVTTYNQVADELVASYLLGGSGGELGMVDEKNVRRRVYDALNVLEAAGAIRKNKKDIVWVGWPRGPRTYAQGVRASAAGTSGSLAFQASQPSPATQGADAAAAARPPPLSPAHLFAHRGAPGLARLAALECAGRSLQTLQDFVTKGHCLANLMLRNLAVPLPLLEARRRTDPTLPNALPLPFMLVRAARDTQVDVFLGQDPRVVAIDLHGAAFTLLDDESVMQSMELGGPGARRRGGPEALTLVREAELAVRQHQQHKLFEARETAGGHAFYALHHPLPQPGPGLAPVAPTPSPAPADAASGLRPVRLAAEEDPGVDSGTPRATRPGAGLPAEAASPLILLSPSALVHSPPPGLGAAAAYGRGGASPSYSPLQPWGPYARGSELEPDSAARRAEGGSESARTPDFEGGFAPASSAHRADASNAFEAFDERGEGYGGWHGQT